MSIRTASILISVLAHGTAYLYLGDFISLERPALAGVGQGMKVAIVRAEKTVQSGQPAKPITVIEPEIKTNQIPAKPPEEQVAKAPKQPLTDVSRASSEALEKQINQLSPTAAGKSEIIAYKRPVSERKPLTVKPPITRDIDTKPLTSEPLQPLAHASVIPLDKTASVVPQVAMKTTNDREAARLLAIEAVYAQALVAAIEKHKRYPLRARKKGQEGEVIVLFTILEDGTISEVHIGESSLSSLLDRAASRAVETLGRFQPIPEQLGRKRWDFQVPVRFAMN